MAHAAVVSLMQLLEEDLIQFPCRVLEFEESKAREFHLRANDSINYFKTFKCFPSFYPAVLKDEFYGTVHEDLIGNAARSGNTVQDNREILSRIPDVLCELEGFKSSLEGFMHDCCVTGNPSPSSSQQAKFVTDLLSANIEFEKVITYFSRAAEKAISLHNRVHTWLQKLNDSDDHRVVSHIKNSAEKAADSIEIFFTGNNFLLGMKDFTEDKNIFSLLEEIDKSLSQTLEDLPSVGYLQRPRLQNPRRLMYKYSQRLTNICCVGAKIVEDTSSKSPKMSRTESSWKSWTHQKDTVVGLDNYMTETIDALTGSTPTLKIVTIAGMGGIGKTTLAKSVFSDDNIASHFHCCEWVADCNSINEVFSQLLHSEDESCDEIQSDQDKGELLCARLRRRRYLIVVDGLWNFEAWNAVKIYLPDDKVGSRILITSRHMEIPKNPRHSLICMRPLVESESWKLLEKLVFGKQNCPPELVDIGKGIAEKCGGLPLAIVVLAGTLRRIPSLCSSWRNIMDSVNSIVSAEPKKCLDILAVSYENLPHHLKACFLFVGAFPSFCRIEAQKLINLWIAVGFLDSKSLNHAEKVAEDYLNDLICRSLLSIEKKSLNGKIKTCRIHDLFRQFCLREAQKENFMRVLEEDANVGGLDKQRHLIFNLDNCADLQIFSSLPLLRSYLWQTLGSDFIPGMVLLQLSGFKLLRVLDMYFLPFDTFPEEILNLVNLRYLALNVTYVLDPRMSRLWKLQTLIIFGPWILSEGEKNPTLFLEYWKMPWLRHVSVKVPSCLRYPQIGDDDHQAPSNLQTLSTISFSCCTKETFTSMPHLKKLGVSETKEDFENDESTKCFQNLWWLKNLEILKCSFHKGNGKTRSLGLDVLPESLKNLTLSGSRLSWDKMRFLASLPKLETLKLKNEAFQGSRWELTEEVFGCLKQLLIDNIDIEDWEAASTDHFPCLELLVLRSCKSLNKIPSIVGELDALQRIELHYCSKTAGDSAQEFEEQYGRPQVIVRSDNGA